MPPVPAAPVVPTVPVTPTTVTPPASQLYENPDLVKTPGSK
jgi:hypothetical protein